VHALIHNTLKPSLLWKIFAEESVPASSAPTTRSIFSSSPLRGRRTSAGFAGRALVSVAQSRELSERRN
jgi:hypothetical protein